MFLREIFRCNLRHEKSKRKAVSMIHTWYERYNDVPVLCFVWSGHVDMRRGLSVGLDDALRQRQQQFVMSEEL